MKTLICPMSRESIDARSARVGATLTAALLIAFGAISLWPIIDGVSIDVVWPILAFVVVDYAVRVLKPIPAPIGLAARALTGLFRVSPRPMNKGPKMFAWRVGFLMALVALAMLPVSPIASAWVALGLAGFNILDGVLNVCVGCLMYTYLIFPFYERRGAVAPIDDG